MCIRTQITAEPKWPIVLNLLERRNIEILTLQKTTTASGSVDGITKLMALT